MYILIQNRNEIDLTGIRLLGLCRKNEDEIGQFGTGLKEAVCLLMRKGIPLVIYSGKRRIDFRIYQDEVCFELHEPWGEHDTGLHRMNLHPDFGKHDWLSLWQAMREIYCNAQDAGELYHNVVPEMGGADGWTQIFLPFNEDTMEVYATMRHKLLFVGNREPLEENDIGTIYAASDSLPAEVNIFHKKVWIKGFYSTERHQDYDLNSLKLTESRSCDIYSVKQGVCKILGACGPSLRREILERAVAISDPELMPFDLDSICLFPYSFAEDCRSVWVETFIERYGSKAILCPREVFYFDTLRARGYRPILMSERLYSTFSKFLPTASKVLNDSEQDLMGIKRYDSEIYQEISKRLGELLPPELFTFDKSKDDLSIMVTEDRMFVRRDIIGTEREYYCYIQGLAQSITESGSAVSMDVVEFLCERLAISYKMIPASGREE